MTHDPLASLLERERVSGLCTELGHARAVRGLTRAAVARQIGVSRSAVSLWELGRQLPDTTSLSAWARALGYELALYIPVSNPELTQSTAALLDEVIDVLAKALLGQDDD